MLFRSEVLFTKPTGDKTPRTTFAPVRSEETGDGRHRARRRVHALLLLRAGTQRRDKSSARRRHDGTKLADDVGASQQVFPPVAELGHAVQGEEAGVLQGRVGGAPAGLEEVEQFFEPGSLDEAGKHVEKLVSRELGASADRGANLVAGGESRVVLVEGGVSIVSIGAALARWRDVSELP